jgi:AAT family amino acid transporter
VVVIAAEALGAAGLLATIFPALPVWLMAFVFIVVRTAVNLTSVKNFGEFEFWFALLKVAAIVGFLLVGAALLFGWLPGDVLAEGRLASDVQNKLYVRVNELNRLVLLPPKT